MDGERRTPHPLREYLSALRAAGKGRGGVSLTLHCDRRDLLVGEEARLLLEVRNPFDREVFLPGLASSNPYNDWAWLHLDPEFPLSEWNEGTRCGNWPNPGYGMMLGPGESRFLPLTVSRWSPMPAHGGMRVSFELRWGSGDAAIPPKDVARAIRRHEGVLRFDPPSGNVFSNRVRLTYGLPVDDGDQAVLRAALGLPDDHPVDLEDLPPNICELSRDIERVAWQEDGPWPRGRWYRIAEDCEDFPPYYGSLAEVGLDASRMSCDEIVRVVRGWDLRHMEDDSLYRVARAVAESGRAGLARELLAVLAEEYPERDHGLRARAWLDGREAGAPALD